MQVILENDFNLNEKTTTTTITKKLQTYCVYFYR